MFGEHSDSGTVRNLDAIQETEPHRGSSRLGALLLASLGGACIVFAAVALVRTAPSSAAPAVDPLGDLVARMKPEGDAPEKTPEAGVGRDVTFPRMLSDADRPTTALEAVRDSKGAAPFNLPPGAPTAPPSAADRLPVVPLPAQAMLEAIPRSEAPDQLTAMARRVSREESNEGAVQAGMPGGFQLQVSSFKKGRRGRGVRRGAASSRPPRVRRGGGGAGTRSLAPRAHRALQVQALGGDLSPGLRGEGAHGDVHRRPAQDHREDQGCGVSPSGS
jgi:DedD protein